MLIQPLSSQTWEKAAGLTDTVGDSISPAIASDSNDNIHVVWREDKSSNQEIYFINTTDGGLSWLQQRITWTPGFSGYPEICADVNDNIHIVWGEEDPNNINGYTEIYYKKSTDGGTSWSKKRITWTSGISARPVITTGSSNNIHVVWEELLGWPNYELYYKKSTDGGVTWIGTRRLTWTSGTSINNDVVVDSGNNIHVVWQDDSIGNNEIYYKLSTYGGVSWSTKRLSWNSGFSGYPAIAADSSDNLQLVWTDTSPGNWEIFHKKSTDGGLTWSGTKRLTWSSAPSFNPAITVDSSENLHIVWEDYSNFSSGKDEIFYKKSTDGGASWIATKRLIWTAGYSEFPAIATDLMDNIYVVWEDDTPGNKEIYYKKGIQ